MQIERSLREAAAEGRLVLHYQPLFTPQGTVQSLEALLRLHDTELGLVSPARFIPIAEESGLISSIGTWVLNEACRQLAQWRAEGRQPVPIAINVSAAQFLRGDFAPEVQRALAEYDLSPDLLELELTESLLMEDIARSREQLTILRKIGVRVAMDDFGTGYSSLSYLDALPLDAIKIDRSFIKNIGLGQSSTILRSIVQLGKSVGLTVIAEGVETEEQRSALVQLHCDQLQGFLLARPAPATEVVHLLTTSDGAHPSESD
jgi:EAL domain-containing protein (putative c-di-GMP-specific phosphodiesterase class I)